MCRAFAVVRTAAPAAAGSADRSLRSHPWPAPPPCPRTQAPADPGGGPVGQPKPAGGWVSALAGRWPSAGPGGTAPVDPRASPARQAPGRRRSSVGRGTSLVTRVRCSPRPPATRATTPVPGRRPSLTKILSRKEHPGKNLDAHALCPGTGAVDRRSGGRGEHLTTHRHAGSKIPACPPPPANVTQATNPVVAQRNKILYH